MHCHRQAFCVFRQTWSSISMVASSQPCMGILRCDSRVVISLDLAASACCPCWTYAGDTRLLAKVRLAEFMLHTASHISHGRFIRAKGHTTSRGGAQTITSQSCKLRRACLQSRLGTEILAGSICEKSNQVAAELLSTWPDTRHPEFALHAKRLQCICIMSGQTL